MAKRFLTTSEVASELRVSTDTVLRLIQSGSLPALRVSERLYRVPAPAFARFKNGPVTRRSVVHAEVLDTADYGDGEDVGGRLAEPLSTPR
ncbi:MAG: excisionase family DNA-binding protein [Aeromicrobium sp.]